MYLRQPCPQCGHEAEFVYVQIGHHHCCKKCNSEFELKPQGVKAGKYVAFIAGLLVAAVIGFFVIKSFHDWWIYGPNGPGHREPTSSKSSR